MLKIRKAKTGKNKKGNKGNILVIGTAGKGMVSSYIPPIIPVTGEDLIKTED